MNDQSYALRLLNKICYEEDRHTPFLPTSPIMGMTHGWYLFDDAKNSHSVYELYTKHNSTAYTEFGVPSIAPAEYLRTFIPEEELFPPEDKGTWRLHHAYGAWNNLDEWACISMLESYFGKSDSIEDLCEKSAWTQCEGYKTVFEEARRQKPHCSMAVNWCYNEPWKTAANNTLLCYPDIPKPSYYAVRDALRNVMPSVRIGRFDYTAGDIIETELWLLNDTYECVSDEIEVYIEIGGQRIDIAVWQTGLSLENENIKGEKYQTALPCADTDRFYVVAKSKKYGESRYMLKFNK